MRLRGFASLLAVALAMASALALPPDVDKALRDVKYVYIRSERKSGEFGKPSEIWFLYDDGSVWVGTRPSSWRVRRIRAGRPLARIAAGSVDGPSFEAKGAIVSDAAREQRLMDAYAKKYPDRWPGFAAQFRDGFKSGDRVLVRYTPR